MMKMGGGVEVSDGDECKYQTGEDVDDERADVSEVFDDDDEDEDEGDEDERER